MTLHEQLFANLFFLRGCLISLFGMGSYAQGRSGYSAISFFFLFRVGKKGMRFLFFLFLVSVSGTCFLCVGFDRPDEDKPVPSPSLLFISFIGFSFDHMILIHDHPI